MSFDFVIVGGGLVGAAVSYGLRRSGASVVMLDEGDTAFRCLLYTSPSPRDLSTSRMPSSA